MSTVHPTLADGRYTILRLIGSGGMAAVFLAEDTVLRIERAIKVLNPTLVVRPQSRSRFSTEAIAMARLNHPTIARVFDHGQEGMTSYIVMEYLAHGSLQRYRHNRGCLPREEALSLCIDVAEALDHAHQNGIIHRDVKPDNILLSPDGARLTDFGLARLSEGMSHHTRTRAILGTPSFMPPEQRLNAKAVTPRADLYALTATLFTLLVDTDPIDLYDSAAQPQYLQDLDLATAALIRRGCHADPDQRFESAAELIEALEALRETPHARRSRLPLSGYNPNASTVDMDELHYVWASYTGRTSTADAPPLPTASSSKTLSLLPLDEPRIDPERTVPTAALDAPAAATVSPLRRWGWGLLPAALVAGLLWFAGDRQATPMLSEGVFKTSWSDLEPGWQAGIDALLAGDPSSIPTLLDGLPTDSAEAPIAYSLYTVRRMLLDPPPYGLSASKESHRLNPDVPLEAALMLAEQSWSSASPPDPAAWNSLRGSDPMIELLYLVSMRLDQDQSRQRRALRAARSRFPEHAIFAYIELSQRRHFGGASDSDEALLEHLDAALSTFPGAPLLLLERGRLLFERGDLDAAGEVMSLVLQTAPDLIQANDILADILAIQDVEHERSNHMLISISDTTMPEEQHRMLSRHGLTMASIGQLEEAEKLWRLCHDLADAAMDDAGRFECTMQALQAMAVLQQTQRPFFAEQREQARTYLDTSPANHHHRRAAEMLAFSEGMAALQADRDALAQQYLEQLQALERDDFLVNPQHLSTQLEVEMVLASQDDDPTARAAARMRLDALGTSDCPLVLLQARLAAAQDEDEAVDALLQRIVERECRQESALPSLTMATAQLWQAERAHAAGRRDDAVQLFRALHLPWESADSSLEIYARSSALAAALSLTE